ncbi:type II toxin-antitoxin system ParD family antitoxin [Aureimonas glaciei]|uniref:Type II toxin-antitoxin system ParD family antitoxin n=1 Tax=Aureimonas glaciei TaxID=1776957 RepID=A0A917DJT9_9HYPH|nr:type II toxin-antitoxin system ParD family antitoxin [Aureimonas glaciei]GGD42010.1 hypothetical protein GCM10011335_50890 [Aureimonas glaciei]
MGAMQTKLGPHFESFIDRQTASGRYKDTAEVLEAALRLLEREEMKLEWLRGEIAKGEASGDPQPFDIDEFLAEMHRESDEVD